MEINEAIGEVIALVDLPLMTNPRGRGQGQLSARFGVNVRHGVGNMMESAKSKNDIPLEASIPDGLEASIPDGLEASIPNGAAPLESILRTEELRRRPWRPPDYEKENRELVALMSALADSPGTILQTLAEKVLEALPADSAGLSLLTKDQKRFYWAAIAGAWQPHIGGGTPRDFGPCGDVLDRNVSMLFTHWERRYPYLRCHGPPPSVPIIWRGLRNNITCCRKAMAHGWEVHHWPDRGVVTFDQPSVSNAY